MEPGEQVPDMQGAAYAGIRHQPSRDVDALSLRNPLKVCECETCYHARSEFLASCLGRRGLPQCGGTSNKDIHMYGITLFGIFSRVKCFVCFNQTKYL